MRRTNGLALVVFLAAGVAGAALGVMGDRWLVRERLERQWDPRAMRARLADDLGMSADQRARLDTILDRRNRAWDSVRTPLRPTMDSIGKAAQAELRQLLTDEQRATYDQMLREREAAQRQEQEKK